MIEHALEITTPNGLRIIATLKSEDYGRMVAFTNEERGIVPVVLDIEYHTPQDTK